jgi:hypothetical protein
VTRDQRKQVAAQVAETRAAQGLPPAITDPATLAQLAAGVDQAGGAPVSKGRRRNRTEVIASPAGPAARTEKRPRGA